MDKKAIKEYAEHLMFKLSDDEIDSIDKDFEVLNAQLDLLNHIDTEGVEEMIFPFDVKTEYLREDKADHILTKEEALYNAPKVKEGHFVVPKVGK